MKTVRRQPLRPMCALLVAALLVASSMLPLAAGTWRCADGSACVFVSGRGYRCPVKRAAARQSCCAREVVVWCDHGAMPAARARPRETTPGLTPCRCWFEVSRHKQATAATLVFPHATGYFIAIVPLPEVNARPESLPLVRTFIESRAGPPIVPSRAPPFTL